ncbi:tRNA lysidine(34) synthetase TilS [Tenacibaculum sp. S7007]|uniref:tRNA(Ile)-lysidine synthase n=1 Tax=Tenacibaculum pelagium TaxID=2759527 RepID=A0A839ANT4_9FLAO|nr:tRNA lysidine(34) synthetase TilS [Tenacibaculum pelagium]MBA6156030.1 tRNA lysidine(34) synthetase TilS [Tenacibaculum pelagium]
MYLTGFAKHINSNFSFLKEKKLLIAISGGIDSVVLTHLLHQLKYNISLAHCNFQLRGKESDLDEVFIKNLSKDLSIKAYTTQFKTEQFAKELKLSTQLAARKLRYDWFYELTQEYDFDYILTAHHADDNLETFLINLTRGTGLEGLTGIPVINDKIVRPLLAFSQEEINNYATKNNIQWREDASNAETKYLRNKIRHEIIPSLKELNPSLLESFTKTSAFLKQSQQIVNDKIKEVYEEIISEDRGILKINISKLVQLSNPKAYLYQLLKDYKFTEWNDVYHLIYAQSGKKVSTNLHTLLKDRDFLLLLRTDKKSPSNQEPIIINKENTRITNPINLLFENVHQQKKINTNSIYVDKNLLNYPLSLRKWREGDYFYPSGMIGKKKISKYFKDEKLSVFDKENIWLLCSNDDKIIWVVGKRQDKRFFPTSKTTELLKMSI